MQKLFCWVITFITLCGGVSCSKSSSPASGDLQSILTQGQWMIHLYLNSGKDETSTYSGYSFTFASTGSLTATKTGTSAGTWTKLNESGYEKLTIQWSGGGIPVELLKLEDKWQVKSKSSTLIDLVDDNPARNDEVHFMKQ